MPNKRTRVTCQSQVMSNGPMAASPLLAEDAAILRLNGKNVTSPLQTTNGHAASALIVLAVL